MRRTRYEIGLRWSGHAGAGTCSGGGYCRDHVIRGAGKPTLRCASNSELCGDPARYNPEELLIASLSSYHMLRYLHLCATNGVVVESYVDRANGVVQLSPGGDGSFLSLELRPRVVVSLQAMVHRAEALHDDAHRRCSIAQTMGFPVDVSAIVEASEESTALGQSSSS